MEIADIYDLLIGLKTTQHLSHMQRIQTARTEQAPAAQIHTTASNPHSTFTIPITDVTMEQRYIPNVSIMSEEQLKHATSSNFIRAKILPETDEYYSK